MKPTVTHGPFGIEIRRGRRLIRGMTLWWAAGESRDQFIQLTEGVIAAEELERRPPRRGRQGRAARRARHDRAGRPTRRLPHWAPTGRPGRASASPASAPATASSSIRPAGASGSAPTAATPARTARPTCSTSAVSRRATTRPCPGCSPAAATRSGSRRGGDGVELDLSHRISVSTRAAAGPFRLHVLTDPTPAARLRRFLRLSASLPALLPEWAYGHWKSRDVYEHQRDVEDDFDGYGRNALPLDAIVIDSPWETQYNTWEPNPHQFDDFEEMVTRFRAHGVRTVVWVTPWVNLESVDGQRPPDPESERLHREPAPNYEPAARAGHFVKTADGEPFVARWWMGTGSPIDFTSPARRRVVARAGQGRPAAGRGGHQGRRRRGLLLPARRALRRRPPRRRGGLGLRPALPALDAARPRRGPPGRRRPVRTLGLDRPAGRRDHLGRRPGVRLLVAARRW